MRATEDPAIFSITPIETGRAAVQIKDKNPRRSGYKIVFLLAGISLVTIISSVSLWRYQRAKAMPQFLLTRIERGSIESTVSATGTCNAVVNVQVGSQVSGNIKALYADFNTVVKAGQLVALIDPQMFQAKVDQAEASWRNSKASLENSRANAAKADADLAGAKASEANQMAAVARAKVAVSDAQSKLARRVQMFSDQILDKESLDTAQATYDEAVADLRAAEAQYDAAVHNVQSAEAASRAAKTQVGMFEAQVELNLAILNQARIDLANTRITSPVDGTVVARQMDVGQTVAASFQAPIIFQIAQDLTKMQIDTNVDESDVGRLKIGQPASFTVDAYPGTVFQGPIIQIRKAPINVQNVITYDAVIEANNPDLKLFPGMTANVTILTQRENNTLKIPNAALRFKPIESLIAVPKIIKPIGPNEHVIYIPGKDSKAYPLSVELGITDGTYTALKRGDLKEKDQIIIGMRSKGQSTVNVAPSIPRRF